ncbi:MAG: acetoin dehydrogenase dihydrolipoyllysine-residue acetyltransferase subunit [Pseudomonadota bacterium]
MPTEVILPKVDMDMSHGTIAAWHVAEGAAVTQGQPLFDIETDKAAMEVESPADGMVHHQTPAGTEVAIGTPVAWLYAEGEEVGPRPDGAAPAAPDARAAAQPLPQDPGVPAADHRAQPAPDQTPSAPAPKTAPDPPSDLRPDPTTGGLRATPAARAAARDAGVDLAAVSGSGPRGRVQRGDVLAFAPRRRAPSGPAVPLVLIHGFGADAGVWRALEAAVDPSRPVIQLELPGHGRVPAAKIRDFKDLVSRIRTEFDALDLPLAELVGHSLGGACALALADTRAPRVAGLTLIAPAGLGPQIDGAAIAGVARASKAESLGPWLRGMVGAPAALSDRYIAAAARARADAGLHAAQSQMAEVLFADGVQTFDLTPALARVGCPLRLIWGKRDSVIPWRHALRAPGRAALHLFDDLGHLPQIEDPAAIAALIAPVTTTTVGRAVHA